MFPGVFSASHLDRQIGFSKCEAGIDSLQLRVLQRKILKDAKNLAHLHRIIQSSYMREVDLNNTLALWVAFDLLKQNCSDPE